MVRIKIAKFARFRIRVQGSTPQGPSPTPLIINSPPTMLEPILTKICTDLELEFYVNSVDSGP